MLPVPYDQPITPLYTYGENNPPAVPAIQVHPDGMALIVPAAAAVANKLTETAGTSTTRMFCYNLVSSNNWTNTDFAHLVRLVVDYTVYKSYSVGGGNVYVLLGQVADEFASLYASYLASAYNEYFIQLDPNTQHRIMQNVQLYNEFTAKADSVYSMAPQAPQHHAMQRNQNMVMNRPQAHHGVHRPNAGYHYPSHTVHGGHRNVAANPAAGALVHQARPMGRDNIVATKFGTVPRAAKVETHNNQGGNMDQDLHRIAYRGNTITAHVGSNMRKVTPAKTSSLNVQKQIKQGQGNELRHMAIISELDKDIDITDIIEPEIMTAFGTVEAMMSAKLKRGVLEIHPFVSLAVIPMISSTKTDTLYTILREARTFTAVSVALKKYKDILNAMDESKADDQYFGNVWLKKVDNFITAHANRYFQSVLPNDGFTTSSVMEDGAELAMTIDKNYGRAALNAFNQFQKNLLSIMFQSDAHTVDSIPELEAGDTKVVDYEIFTVKTLIAYLTVTWDELSGGMRTIRQIVTKDSEGRLKEVLSRVGLLAKNTGVSRVYVMLTDGVRLAVFEDATEPGTFKITEE